MSDRWFEPARKFLVGFGIVITLFGVAVAVDGGGAWFSPYNEELRRALFGDAPWSLQTLALRRFLYGLIGGTIAAKYSLLAFVAAYAMPTRARWTFWAVLLSTLLWFVLDSTSSWLVGARFNVLFNVGPLLSTVVPLALMRNGFTSPRFSA